MANAGGGATTVNVSCSGNVTTTLSPEPTNYTTSFSAHNIHLQWVDAPGPVVPDAYLIRMSSVGFSSITTPTDHVAYANSATDQNVAFGIQSAWFKNLSANTTYYFKMFSYSGSGTGIDYKTDGSVPQLQQVTGQ
ncbi:MAG: hypothetical protein WCR72_00300 [Bacteroidota bacterium]